MNDNKDQHEQAQALLVQGHQLTRAEHQLGSANVALDVIAAHQASNEVMLAKMIAQAEAAIAAEGIAFVDDGEPGGLIESAQDAMYQAPPALPSMLEQLDYIDIEHGTNWRDYRQQIASYTTRQGLSLQGDPYQELMSTSQRIALEKRIKEEFSLQPAHCDSYDYMIAGTCGLIGGMIDVFFVGTPGTGALGKFTDDMTNKAVEKFASYCGWKGPNQGSNSTRSAIGFLEGRFKVNYDQAHSGHVDKLFKMSPSNHHVKNLAHSPDLVGMFFSILDQFTSTSHFIADGKLVSIDTATFELSGSGFAGKILAGFCNWIGHLFSDMAGSSGAMGRGSGIPVPFYSLLQFIDVGKFGQHRQTFATVAVRVFEGGYDLRHGMAMAIPVLVTELMTRLMWTFKQRFYHDRPWEDCLPSASQPELRRMLLVAHGSLCLVDTADAALRSGGDIVTFLLRSNMIAWVRFGTVALSELKAWTRVGDIDDAAVDSYLDAEYRRILGLS